MTGLLAELASYGYDAAGRLFFFLLAGDLTHGVVEGQAKDLDVEVNGVAGEVAFGPAPVTVFEDETRKGGQDKIARLACEELESAFLQ